MHYRLDVTYTRRLNCKTDFNEGAIHTILEHLQVIKFESGPRRVRIVATADHWIGLQTAATMLNRKLGVGRYTTVHPEKFITKIN